MNSYYVYELRRPTGEVFYVGKGIRWRIESHENDAKKNRIGHLYNVIRKLWSDGQKVHKEKVATGLTNDTAMKLECELIAKYGRKCDGGTLVNITLGGEGAPGYRHGQAAKEKMSIARRRRVTSDETRRRISASSRGRSASQETRKKISDSISGAGHWNFGKRISPEHAEKMHSAIRKPVVVNGIRYQSISAAAEVHGIKSNSALYRITRGKNRGNYGEWKWGR